jgi:hypothetical protein
VSAPVATSSGSPVRTRTSSIQTAGPGRRLGLGADDRRDDQERDVRVAFAHRVQEAVDGRPEGPDAEGPAQREVDAELEADQVGRGVADRPRDERV